MPRKQQTTKPVADQVREAILASGVSRYEISKLSGVDQARLSRFMQGSGLVVEGLEAIADALGLEIALRRKGKDK